MIIQTKLSCRSGYLNQFAPADPNQEWFFIRSGAWSEDIYHSGKCALYITCDKRDGTWLIKSIDLPSDDEAEEEVSAKPYEEIIAICTGAPEKATVEEMAEIIYDTLWDVGLGLDE